MKKSPASVEILTTPPRYTDADTTTESAEKSGGKWTVSHVVIVFKNDNDIEIYVVFAGSLKSFILLLYTHVLMESELGKSENIGQNSNLNTFQQV